MHWKLALGQTQWGLPGYSQGSLRTLYLLLHGALNPTVFQKSVQLCGRIQGWTLPRRKFEITCETLSQKRAREQTKPGVVAHTSDPRSWKTRARQLPKLEEGIPGYIVSSGPVGAKYTAVPKHKDGNKTSPKLSRYI